LADRYQQLSDDLAQFDLFKDFFGGLSYFKSLIFCLTLAEDEYRLYRNLLISFTECQWLYVWYIKNSEL
jgi:hypothetical protein